MTGYAQPIEPAYGPQPEPGVVIGIAASRNFPAADIEQIIRRGIAARPEAVWVVRGKPNAQDLGLQTVVRVLSEAGIEPLHALPAWSGASIWRDGEMANLCTEVVVFRDLGSPSLDWWAERAERWPEKIHVVNRGKKKKPTIKRKGRNPHE